MKTSAYEKAKPNREAPVTVRMDKALRNRLLAHCRASDLTVSQLIRRAVKRELAS